MLDRIEDGSLTIGDILDTSGASRREETNTADVANQGSDRAASSVPVEYTVGQSEATYNDALILAEHYSDIGKLYSSKAWALTDAMRNVRLKRPQADAKLQETIAAVGLITAQEKAENDILKAGTKISELLLSAILQIPDGGGSGVNTMGIIAGLALPEVRAFKQGAQDILNLRQTVEPSKPVWPPVKLSGDNAQFYPKV